MKPSVNWLTSRAWSGVLMPKPNTSGISVRERRRAMKLLRWAGNWRRAPVMPVSQHNIARRLD